MLGKKKGRGMLKLRSYMRGVSLIELVISLAVVGLLMTAAIPALTKWVQNSQIRTVTESVLSGIQFAKVEAIKRNQQVEIVFDADFHAWNINLVTPQTLLRRQEGLAEYSSITIVPDAQNTDRLTFSGLGRILQTNPSDASQRFNLLSVDNSHMTQTESDDLSIRISDAGAVRMCNPNKVAPDPRAC